MSLTFAMVLRSGGVYSPMWVERLARQAREHLKPDRIVCLTDEPPGGTQYVRLAHDWPGWFCKMELFRPGLFAENETVLYVDLDSLLVAPIPDLRARLDSVLRLHPLMMLDDFYSPKLPASGVMAWRPCRETEKIYEKWAYHPHIAAGWRNGDGMHIGGHPHGRLQRYFPGVFGSFKKDKLHHGPRDFRIVCQHGLPKFNDLPDTHWMCRAWRGESYA